MGFRAGFEWRRQVEIRKKKKTGKGGTHGVATGSTKVGAYSGSPSKGDKTKVEFQGVGGTGKGAGGFSKENRQSCRPSTALLYRNTRPREKRKKKKEGE